MKRSPPSEPKAGDIVLEADSELEPDHYTLEVTDRARIRAADYAGVASGTVTLLQASNSGLLPRMTIADHPHSSYRGLLLDLARHWRSVLPEDTVKVKARFFDETGQAKGEPWERTFSRLES